MKATAKEYMNTLKTVSNAVREMVSFLNMQPLSMNQMLEAYLYELNTYDYMSIDKAGKELKENAKPFLFWGFVNENKNGKRQYFVNFRFAEYDII